MFGNLVINFSKSTPQTMTDKLLTGNAEAAVMLLDAGARLYKQDKKKMTCLHLAAARNHISVVSILLARKVNFIL